MKLVVGLGNPGNQYHFTRHNIGFLILNGLQETLNLQFKNDFNGLYAKTKYQDVDVIFFMPLTYMNLSGTAVLKIAAYYKIKTEDILVIHDELDFVFGKIQFKKGGSYAGHNGVKNIYQLLNNKNIYRLRIGIGKNQTISNSDWVLGKFSKVEIAILEAHFTFLQQAILDWITSDNYQLVISKYNNKVLGALKNNKE